MSLSPVAFIAPNFRDYKNYWLKAYETDGTTPKSMALDAAGSVTVAKLEINKDGFIETAGGALVIPYIDGAYDLFLFPTEAEADSNNTSNALRLADDILGVNGAGIANSTVLKYDTLDDAVTETNTAIMFDGAALNLKERTTGNDGGAMWDVVLASTVTPNTYNIVICTGIATLALVLRDSVNQSIRAWGGVLDAVADDTGVLQAFDAAGGHLIEGGIARVRSSIALTSNYEFKNGGVIAVDDTFTITWSGTITASDVLCLFGDFQLTKVHKVQEVKVSWFGGLSSDLLTDMSDLTLANANAKAIRQAANMCKLGGTDGIYITPILRLLNGLCLIDDDDNDGVVLAVSSYMTVLGYGDSSVLRPMNAAKTLDVISMIDDSANSMVLDDFQIYGEASEQTNVQNGITVNPPTNSQIYNKLGNGVYVKEMSGHAGQMLGFGWENSKWNPKLMRDSTLHNLLVTRCNEVEFTGCTYRTAKSGQSGAVFDGAGVVSAHIHANNFDENNVSGLIMSNTGGRHRVHDNGMKSNFTGYGASFDGVDHSQISFNKFEANALSGSLLDTSTNVDWIGNKSRVNQQNGQVFGCDNSTINNNSSYADGQGTDDTYSGLFLTGGNCDDNNVQSNKVRHGGGATQLKYGMQIDPGTATSNLVTNNDLKDAGRTANLFDNGGSTVTTAGNRV